MIIITRNDIVNHINDIRPDLTDLGEHYVQAVVDQIQVSDHPVWGSDWTEWINEWLDSVIEETVDGLDALDED